MKPLRRSTLLASLTILLLAAGSNTVQAAPAIATRTAEVDGVKFQYLSAGEGQPLILIHGYAQSSHMWKAVIPKLATRYKIIAPDLPGIGESAIPADGLDMKTAAIRVHALVASLGISKARVVGHDIGLMVAYAYAAQFPAEVERLVVMDAFLPGVGDWLSYYHNPALWHFFFNGPTAEALVKGRERTYFEHFWNDFAADKTRSLPESDRRTYAAQYARPGRMRAGWAYFAAFPKTATEFAQLATTKLTMPVLVIAGEKASGEGLGQQLKVVAKDVNSVVLKNTGHWVLEENQRETMAALERFLDGTRAAAPATATSR